jgi:hypothetical protein
MLRAALTGIAMTSLAAPPATAGAWPQSEGTGFATAAVQVAWPQDIAAWTSTAPTEDYQTLYLEYGLTPDWTVGLDLGRSVSGADKTIGFVQYPLRNRDNGPKATAQIGFGELAGAWVVRPGLSVGWGFEQGWLSFDSVAEVSQGGTDWKLDIALGRRFERGRMAIVQLQTGDPDAGQPFVRLAPSYVFPWTERLKVEAGGTWGLKEDASIGVKLGLWVEF